MHARLYICPLGRDTCTSTRPKRISALVVDEGSERRKRRERKRESRSIRLRGENPAGVLSTRREPEFRDAPRGPVHDQEERRRASQARRNIRWSRVVEDVAAGAAAAAGTVVGFILKGRDTRRARCRRRLPPHEQLRETGFAVAAVAATATAADCSENSEQRRSLLSVPLQRISLRFSRSRPAAALFATPSLFPVAVRLPFVVGFCSPRME